VAETQQKKPKPPTHLSGKRSYLGTGRRKTAQARVRITEGSGQFRINGRTVEEFFTEVKDRNDAYAALDATDMRARLDVDVLVTGGGITGQSGAIKQGVARALKTMFGGTPAGADGTTDEAVSNMAKLLRDSGCLTRDGRMKERKKYGRKGARKSFQFSKR
jgi:small subunit ribosomal protein S9